MSIYLAAADATSHILPHNLFKIGPIWITNQMLMAAVAAILMLLIFPALFIRAKSDAPTGVRNFFESILEFLRVEVFRPALKEKTDQFVPFLWTLFFFILFCNLLGLIPIGSLLGLIKNGGVWSEVTGTATGNINATGALALCALVAIHLSGVVQVARDLINGTYGHHDHHEEHTSTGEKGHESAQDLEHVRSEALAADVPGNMKCVTDPTHHYKDDESLLHPGHINTIHAAKGMNPLLAIMAAFPLYLWNFAPHPFRPQPGQSSIMWLADVPMWAMLLLLELLGAVIKPFALTMRLFANMIAGHLVLAAMIGLITLGPSILRQIGVGALMMPLILLILIMEIFVAFLQAYIFTFLTTLFIASAVAPEH